MGQGGELGGWGDDGVGRAGLKWFSKPLTPTTRYASLQMLGFNGSKLVGPQTSPLRQTYPFLTFALIKSW